MPSIPKFEIKFNSITKPSDSYRIEAGRRRIDKVEEVGMDRRRCLDSINRGISEETKIVGKL
jgi:3-dehydroquinate synthase class II